MKIKTKDKVSSVRGMQSIKILSIFAIFSRDLTIHFFSFDNFQIIKLFYKFVLILLFIYFLLYLFFNLKCQPQSIQQNNEMR